MVADQVFPKTKVLFDLFPNFESFLILLVNMLLSLIHASYSTPLRGFNSKKLSFNKLKRFNHRRFYFLLELVELSDHINYFYVKKLDNTQILKLLFDGKFFILDKKTRNNLKLLLKKLEPKYLNKVSY